MVTKKKSTSTATRKSPVKSQARTKSVSKSVHAPVYRTFRVASDFPTFLQPKVSKQTFYWTFLLLFIIVMQLIIIATNINSTMLLDSLNVN